MTDEQRDAAWAECREACARNARATLWGKRLSILFTVIAVAAVVWQIATL